MKILKIPLNKFIFAALIILGIISGVLAFNSWQTESRLKNTQQTNIKGVDTTSRLETESQKIKTSEEKQPSKTSFKHNPTPTPAPTHTTQATNNTSQTNQASDPTPTPVATSTNQVNLSINGGANFSVVVNKDANQCDVLSKALEQGKISSLNIRYDKTYETYAVYQINGIGKENSVWWVYTVNGQSPTQGCSYIKVSNGDNIEWKYIGS